MMKDAYLVFKKNVKGQFLSFNAMLF